MNTAGRILKIEITADIITAWLVDGSIINVPLVWSWRLADATPAQRRRFEIIGDGQGVHWPEIDEDISAEGMLHGLPAHRPKGDILKAADSSKRSKSPAAEEPERRWFKTQKD
jgi:hypothetical protein